MRNFLLFTLITIFFVGLSFQSKAQVGKAQTKLSAGDFAGAKEAIDNAITDEKAKGKAKTWFIYGQVYNGVAGDETANALDEEAPKKAIEGFQKAKEMGYKASDVEYYNSFLFAGRMAFQADDLESALVAFEEAQKVTENNPIPYMFALEIANATEAYDSYKNAVEVLLTIEDGNYDVEGNKLAEGIPDVVPFSKGDYYGYYAFYFRDVENDYEKALEIVENGLETYPANATLQQLLVDLYVKLDRLDEALEKLETDVQSNPTANGYYNLGTIYDKSGDVDKAKESYEKALELEAENANALYNLGALYYNKGALIVKEINNMSIDEYQDKGEQMEQEALALYDKALPYFEKLYELNPETINRAAVLEPLQTLYKNKNNMEAYERVTEELDTLRGN